MDDEPRATSTSGRRVDAFDAGHASPLAPADAGPSPVHDAGAPSQLAADAGADTPTDAGTPGLTVDAGQTAPADAGRPVDAGAALAGADAGREPDGGVVAPAAPGPGATLSAHTALGLPDTSAVGALDRWLLVKPQFVVSYDTVRKTPRWVSWRLDTTWLGTATRATSFRRDAQLPLSAGQARDEDFRNSGFERGHLCPSADRTNTDPDNDATFVFTNVVPQTRASNGGTWATLEDEARAQARLGKTVFLVAGPLFGVTPQSIGAGVPVPTSTFKVAVIVDGQVGAAPSVTTSTRVIAVVVPNTASVSGSWRAFRVSVRSVEQATGLDFLSDVPRAVQDVVETRVDAEP
ncbi:MAG: DNA/RNA non-specific endonuclease [Myxococcaceae bacterium]|nr:DNA/RNA non-specific endonuclease [Myxococcaceae bacterium]